MFFIFPKSTKKFIIFPKKNTKSIFFLSDKKPKFFFSFFPNKFSIPIHLIIFHCKEKQFSLSKISSSKNGSITEFNIPIEYLNYKTYKTFVSSNIGKKHDLLKVDLKIDISKVVYELIVDKLEIISNKSLKDYIGDYYFVNNFINRMQRNYYMDIIDKKFIVYIPNTNYKTLSQELSYYKHTFLLSKTKFCDSILFNQIYNQENIFEDILTKNVFSKQILNYTLKGFNFVEIILIC